LGVDPDVFGEIVDIRFNKKIPINLGLGFDKYDVPIAAMVMVAIDANHDGLDDFLFTMAM
jgi:hypothetical protein